MMNLQNFGMNYFLNSKDLIMINNVSREAITKGDNTMTDRTAEFIAILDDYISRKLLLDRMNCIYFALGFFDVDGAIPTEVILYITAQAEQGKIRY